MRYNRYLKWVAIASTLGMLAILLGGALVTKTDSGLGCGRHWPGCNGQLIPSEITAEVLIEFSHRIVTGAVSILILILAVWTWRAIGHIRETKFLAILALFFLVLQALIGAAQVLWGQGDFILALHFGISLISYTVQYYKDRAKELEATGAHILAIKDMAGLLKPEAAYRLISELKATVNIPIHLHTHDTSGNGIYMYARAIEAGVDIVDTAVSAMAGLTSQPSASSLAYALQHNQRQVRADVQALEDLSHYWEDVRKYYSHFESGMNSPHSEIYVHEMPGGQYSNLQQQAKAVGLGERWEEVKEMYSRVNLLFGDVVKVTPSSKVVGDMALFMVQNDLDETSVIERGPSIDFPESVIEFFEGYIGQPYGGFPKELQQVVLKERKPITVRPGELLDPVDFDELRTQLTEKLERPATMQEALAHALYPKVFEEYSAMNKEFGDISVIDTPEFLYGMLLGEEIEIDIEIGKTLIIKLVSIGEPQPNGTRVIYFELNGQPREVVIQDMNIESDTVQKQKADPSNAAHIAATMPGTVLKITVSKGAKVKRGEHLLITEAMKMETTIQAPFDGVVKEIYVEAGDSISTGDLLVELEN